MMSKCGSILFYVPAHGLELEPLLMRSSLHVGSSLGGETQKPTVSR